MVKYIFFCPYFYLGELPLFAFFSLTFLIFTVNKHGVAKLVIILKLEMVNAESNVQKQPPEVFYKKGVLKNFARFAGKACARASFLMKLQT